MRGSPTSIFAWFLCVIWMMHGGCIQGSPSICIGNDLCVLEEVMKLRGRMEVTTDWMTTVEHCERRLAPRTPALICPICIADSRPTSWKFQLCLDSEELRYLNKTVSDVLDSRLQLHLLRVLHRKQARHSSLRLSTSTPQIGSSVDWRDVQKSYSFEGGILSKVNWLAVTLKSFFCASWLCAKLTRMSICSCKFLQELERVSLVPNSKYHNLFLIRLLNFSGNFSLITWNRCAIEASWITFWICIDCLSFSDYHSDWKVIVDDAVRRSVSLLTCSPVVLALRDFYFYLPSIHVNQAWLLDLFQDLVQILIFVSTSPSQTSRQIVTSSQGEHCHRGPSVWESQLVHWLQNPSNRSVASTHKDVTVLECGEQL